MTRITVVIAAGLALAVTLPSVSAQAQNGTLTRSFVSSAGVDTNPCTITQPCATFAHAYTAIGANGIIAALDPGKYGQLTITGPVTVNGNGWAAITGLAQNNAITINANTNNGDGVILNGLEIDGAGAAYNGIVFNSGGSLTVTNCEVRNFVFNSDISSDSGNGILMQPISGPVSFAITDSTVSNNGIAGILYSPPSGSATANGVIDHVVATNNSSLGILINPVSGGGSTTVDISNSVASNNANYGIFITNGPAPLTVSIDNTGISGNGLDGIDAEGTPNVLLGRSVINANGRYGINNGTSPNSFYSYLDNRINKNGTGPTDDVNGTMITDAFK